MLEIETSEWNFAVQKCQRISKNKLITKNLVNQDTLCHPKHGRSEQGEEGKGPGPHCRPKVSYFRLFWGKKIESFSLFSKQKVCFWPPPFEKFCLPLEKSLRKPKILRLGLWDLTLAMTSESSSNSLVEMGSNS
jgi:hypothetical protein